MDNLTHTLTGLALARSGLSGATRGATAALVLASNLPDVDVVTWLAGTTVYLQHHRDLTHSVVGAPLLALALATLLRLTVRGSRFLALLACGLVGVGGHAFMDLWTSYGTRVLSPFDRTWYTWDLVFIVDPLILILLAGGLLVPRRLPAGLRPAAASLALVLAYVGGRAALHARATDLALARIPSGEPRRLAVMPTPIDPTRWRVLADSGPAYWTGEVRLVGSAPPLHRRDKRPEDPVVQRVRETSDVAATFLDFSPFPWLEVRQTPDGTAVTWTDLRFERPGEQRFLTRVVVGRDGRIRSEDFRF
ncbi:MAG: metal-dependent hydrolase [Acidobacteria bacterium]|nr:metal-dependent hydrolase [Acidobacteriota bacterium]